MIDAKIDICVLGTGMVGYHQLTKECEQMLGRATEIFVLHPLPEVREYFYQQYESVVDLTCEYEYGSDRNQIYQNMANRVLDTAVDAEGLTAMAVYGHPTVGVAPTELIRDGANERDLTVAVLPGVSSIDCIFTALGFNPLDRGLQIFEATDLLVYDIKLDSVTPALIMQLGTFGTRLYGDQASSPERFIPLKKHISQFYPAEHQVQLIRIATLPFAQSEQIIFNISEFTEVADKISNSHTLYIPPTCEREIEKEEFAEKTYSQRYLERITKRNE